MSKSSHALNPLAAALFASAALALTVAAGSTCSFITVSAQANNFLKIFDASAKYATTSTTLGIYCEGNFYSLNGDSMWILSRVFISVAIMLTAVNCVVAWGISTVWLPSWRAWKAISIMAALSAVFQIPVFLVFEAAPCSDFKNQQSCVMSTGSYLLITGLFSAIAVALITQCLEPPLWVIALDQWRVGKQGATRSFAESLEGGHVDAVRVAGSIKEQAPSSNMTSKKPEVRIHIRDEEEGLDQTDPNSSSSSTAPKNWQPFPAAEFFYADYDGQPFEAQSAQQNKIGRKSRDELPVSVNNGVMTVSRSGGSSLVTGNASRPDAAVWIAQTTTNSQGDSFKAASSSKTQSTRDPPGVQEVMATGDRHLRKPKRVKGYSFMDDDDIESSFPMSPPFEVLMFTNQVEDDTELADEAVYEDNIDVKDSQDLLEDWDKLHHGAYFARPVLAGVDPPNKTESSMFDQHGYLREGALDRTAPDVVIAAVLRRRAKRSHRQRKKRKNKARSSSSVTSSPSLLDTTIEEETPEDLVDADEDGGDGDGDSFNPYGDEPGRLQRTRSAPNLHSYGKIVSEPKRMVECVHMDGVNSYHIVQTWGSFDDSVDHGDALSKPRPVMVTPEHGDNKMGQQPGDVAPKDSPAMDDFDPPFGTEELHVDGQVGSKHLSRAARLARIHRLQLANRHRSVSPPKARATDKKNDRASPDEYLDTLDLRLIEFQRPEGKEYGPDEASL